MKTILITGAASGIGKATALLFAKKGWYVGLYDINESSLEPLARDIGEKQCCYSSMDVADKDSVKQAMAHFAGNTGGKIHVDRKSTRLNSSHRLTSRMPSSA
jgi:NADP-dependent 3-hydroxy acid dehydrogenase YdfG